MTTLEDIESKIKTISERNSKKEEKYENYKKENLIRAKHTNEMIPAIITIAGVGFVIGMSYAMFIIFQL